MPPAKHAPNPATLRPLLKNIFSNWAGLGVNLAVAFLMAPYTVHKLGTVQYGIWALVLQLTGYMGVFDVGIRSALVRFVARSVASDDESTLSQTLSTTFVLYCGLAGAVLGIGAVLLTFGFPLLQIPAEYAEASRITFILGTITLALGFPFGMFQAALAGASRWDLNNGVAIIVLLVRTAIVLYLLYAGYGVVALAVTHLVTSILGWSAGAFLAKRTLRFSIHLRSATRRMLAPILDHSWNSMLISVANRINYQVDTIVIGIFLPIQYVTIYVIGFELVRYFRELLNSAAQVMAPIVGGLDARGQGGDIRNLVLRGGKFATLFGYFGATLMIFIGPQFIGVWMGREYIETSGLVLQIMAFSLFGSATAHMPSHSLFGLGKHRVNVWCTAVEAVINLSVSLFLVRRVGIYGVAAGTLVASFLVRGIIFPAAFLSIFGIPARDYLSKLLLPAVAPTVTLAGALYFALRWLTVDSYPELVGMVIYGTAVFGAMTWWLALEPAERQRFRQLARKAFTSSSAGDAKETSA
ncbi:MAG: oligosaccharide flippase family protein [Terriglobales bacterium]